MRARLIKSLIDTGAVARDFIRLVCRSKPTPEKRVVEDTDRAGASQVLEAYRSEKGPPEALGLLTGRRVIAAMDEQLRDTGWPYASSAGQEFADWVTRGSFVSLPGDDRRYEVLKILWEREAIRVRDNTGAEYIVPWKIIRPWDGGEPSE